MTDIRLDNYDRRVRANSGRSMHNLQCLLRDCVEKVGANRAEF